MSDLVDLSPAHFAIVESLLEDHVPDCEVRAFGSRATWTAKDYSDLDLAVVGDGSLDRHTLSRLKEAFEESILPMRVDVIDWHAIADSFRQTIEPDCVVIHEFPRRAATSARAESSEPAIPDVPGRYSTIGEFAPFLYGKSLPKRQRNTQGHTRVYGSNGILGHHDTALTSGPTIIIGRKGTVGAVHYSPDPCWPIDTTFFVEGDDDPLLHRFKYYALQAADLLNMNADSAVPGLNRNEAHAKSIYVPPVAEQHSIARVLGSLDDKIELNRRMSETLDAIARALFRSWFVNFDPVHAKAEGQPSGLPPDLDALFPHFFEPSDWGDIPAGWQVVPLSDCISIEKGLSYKGSGLSDDGIPLHNLNSIHRGGGYKPNGIKFYAGDYRDRHNVEPGDVIVANTDLGHDRLLIGSAAIVPSYFGSKGLFSHHLYRARPRDGAGLCSDYVLHLLNSAPIRAITSAYAIGTTVDMLPLDALKIPTVIIPTKNLVEPFSNFARALRTRQDELLNQSRTLETVRDTLLPELLSGKTQVEGASRSQERRSE